MDILRFLAAFEVMAGHARGFSFVEYDALHNKNLFSLCTFACTRFGFESVLIFFVLSGFLVGGISISKVQNNNFRIVDFIIDRSVRILLPLISAIIFIIIVNEIIGNNNNPLVIIGNLFSLQNVFVKTFSEPFWSLPYEVWAYVLTGALIQFFKSKKYKTIALIFIIISMMIFVKLSIIYLFVWILGVMSYFLFKNKSQNIIILFSSLLFSIFFLVLIQIASQSKSFVQHNIYISRDWTILMFAFAFCIFVAEVIKYIPKTKFGIKINVLGTNMARFSYILYLTHVPVLYLLYNFFLEKRTIWNFESILQYLFVLSGNLVVAYTIYWGAEKRTSYIKLLMKNFINGNK